MADGRKFKSRKAWREWLSAHGAQKTEQWVIFIKKHTGRQTFSYEEAVEEAICFGWIDGIVRRLDDETYQQRFTPRKKGGTWSETNLVRARRMIDAGKMTRAGLEMLGDALERYEKEGVVHRAPSAQNLPEELMALLKGNARAHAAFEKLAPSHRRQYLGWVLDAKRPETRLRRVKELISVLAAGKKLGLK